MVVEDLNDAYFLLILQSFSLMRLVRFQMQQHMHLDLRLRYLCLWMLIDMLRVMMQAQKLQLLL